MGTYTDDNPTPLDMTGWNTVFFDGFNGTQLDWNKWPITYGGSMYWNNAFWWDNGQLSVGNGELTIGMDKLEIGIWAVGGLSTAPYPGAPADAGHGFTYGRVEIRAKTSEEVGGAGPCFLLWPTSNDRWPPEIDILETPANGQGMFTVHYPGPDGTENGRGYDSQFFELDHSQWHTYTLDWLPDRLTLYVDGVKVAETTENIPDIPMSVGLQGHVGTASDGWYGSPNDSGVNSVDISVDWVRVSQYTGETPPPAPQPTPDPAPSPQPAPAPEPAPDPQPTPEPAPQPAPEPLPQPAPEPQPEPVPQPAPQPAPGSAAAATQGDDTLTGTDGADRLRGLGGNDVLDGGAGRDVLRGGAGDDWLRGGEGNDRLLGGAGSDDLQGGAGDDMLRGGRDHDGLTGGEGVDSFVFARGDGPDWIVDFDAGVETLRLLDIAPGEVTQRVESRWEFQGLALDFGNGDEIYLQGVTAPLAERDLVFA